MRMDPEYFRVGRPEATVPSQSPEGGGGIADTRLAAAAVRSLGNPAGSCGHRSISCRDVLEKREFPRREDSHNSLRKTHYTPILAKSCGGSQDLKELFHPD